MEGAGGGGDSKELERREKRLVKSRPEVQFLGVSFGLSIHCTHEYSVFQTKAPFFFQFSWVGHFKKSMGRDNESGSRCVSASGLPR